jgi:hypothetical protein
MSSPGLKTIDDPSAIVLREETTNLSGDALVRHGPLHEEANTSERRVSFAEDIVTDIWTRPYTAASEKSTLFYSGADIQGFRREYRTLVRQRLAEKQSQASSTSSSYYSYMSVSGWMRKVSSMLKYESTESSVLVDTMYLF